VEWAWSTQTIVPLGSAPQSTSYGTSANDPPAGWDVTVATDGTHFQVYVTGDSFLVVNHIVYAEFF